MEAEILLETEGLVKVFGDLRAVDGLDLQVRSGEMVGLVGPDGAGKTTTIRLLCGLLTQTSGRIRIAGYELPQEVEKAREHIGYLAQRFSLYGDLTVRENLEFFGAVFGVPDAEIRTRSQELLAFAGLTEFADRRAAALSGGMQKKLGLASALVHRPKVLLLDEPTGAVDPVARQEFWQLLIGLLRAGSGVLVSTPYMDEAMRFNKVIFMNRGRALVLGKPRELMGHLERRILELAAAPQTAARRVAQVDPDVEDVHAFGDRLHIRVSAPEGPMARLPVALAEAGVELIHLLPVSPTLEDVFIQLLEEEANDYQPAVH
ncbi:MAG TPA: ABC transporter ATP-binding protein [Aggregatilineales bacterium]|nr:ABC transporter ATP-binding protein [Aggregatilineales bacterium]